MIKHTIPDWIKFYGKKIGIRDKEYVRRCCRGDEEKNGKPCHLPDGWIGWQLKKGTQWFIVSTQEFENIAASEDSDPIDQALKQKFHDAKLDAYVQHRLNAMAKEAVITGRPIRLLLEFHPSNHIDLLPVERIFDEKGREISTSIGGFEPKPNESLMTKKYWHLLVHKQWLIFHVFNKNDNNRKEELRNVIDRHVPKELSKEIEIQLHRRCIWCGRTKPADKRPQAKYCDRLGEPQCERQFKLWLAHRANEDQYKRMIAVGERMEQIRIALET